MDAAAAGMTITVTRVREEHEERVITTTERILRDEFLLPAKVVCSTQAATASSN
jgi:hypothetical protein